MACPPIRRQMTCLRPEVGPSPYENVALPSLVSQVISQMPSAFFIGLTLRPGLNSLADPCSIALRSSMKSRRAPWKARFSAGARRLKSLSKLEVVSKVGNPGYDSRGSGSSPICSKWANRASPLSKRVVRPEAISPEASCSISCHRLVQYQA